MIVTCLTASCAHRRALDSGAAAEVAPAKAAEPAAATPREPEGPLVHLDRTLSEGARPAFASHRGKGAFSTYVAVPLPAAPALALHAEVQTLFAEKLISRGEAHVTAITPPEYHDALAAKLSIEEIEAIGKAQNLAAAQIEPVCLGRAMATVEGRRESAYYVVVRAPDILRFRQAVAAEFVARGGDPNRFRADRFYPHVTVGFTKRDLHEEDGAIKDAGSCKARIAGLDAVAPSSSN